MVRIQTEYMGTLFYSMKGQSKSLGEAYAKASSNVIDRNSLKSQPS